MQLLTRTNLNVAIHDWAGYCERPGGLVIFLRRKFPMSALFVNILRHAYLGCIYARGRETLRCVNSTKVTVEYLIEMELVDSPT